MFNQKFPKKIFYFFIFPIVTLSLIFIGNYFIYAWTEPIHNPPQGGISIIGMPAGAANQTVRYDNATSKWVGDGLILNNGTNVGIGTSNLGAKLSVDGGANDIIIAASNDREGPFNGAGSASIIIQNTDTGNNGGPAALRLMRGGATRWAWVNDVQGNATDNLTLWEAGNLRPLVITEGGNIGINTENPGTKLEVNGEIKLTNGVGAYGAGRVQAFSGGDIVGYTMNSTSRVWDIISIVSGNPDYFAIRDNTAASNRLIINETGNVGIGVMPSYKLDVSGDINFTGTLRKNNTPVSSGITCWNATFDGTSGDSSCVAVGGFCVSVNIGNNESRGCSDTSFYHAPSNIRCCK